MIDVFTGDFDFLSNFYIEKYGKSNEHIYQSKKTIDQDWKTVILNAPTPGKAKKYGRACPKRSNWNDIRVSVMEKLVREKFKDTFLALKLTDTFPEKIVEGNLWHDNFWGDCGCDKCKTRKGKNNLGRILMKIRKEIIEIGRLT